MQKCLLIIIFIVFLPALAFGQEPKQKFEGLLNQLLAPGPLILGHEKLEHTDCLKCHEAAGGVPNKLCLDCHKEIRRDVEAKNSFHGLMNNKACIDCHKDHKGRNFDSIFVQTKTFDHSKTGFSLDGAHEKTDCVKCHVDKRKEKAIRTTDARYFGTVNSCNKCHIKDDIHFFKTKFKQKECSLCHTTEKWKPAKAFDHAKETSYALIESHLKLDCDKCHVKISKVEVRYNWPLKTKQCLSCHKDQHGSNLSPRFQNGKCDVCHGQDTWKLHL